MEQIKLTVRLPRKLLERAKQFARENDTTLTDLIKSYLQNIPARGLLEEAPIVERLSGSLSPLVTIVDYHAHLEEKYGG